MNANMAEGGRASQFLSAEDYKILDGLIGDKHQSLIALRAKLYITEFETEPRKKEGVLSIVVNLKNEVTTFQMYSLETKLFLWSKNTPEKLEEYVVLEDDLHFFKSDNSLFHFKFEKGEEGKAFENVIRRLFSKEQNLDKASGKENLEPKSSKKSISKFSKSESDLTLIDRVTDEKPKPQKGFLKPKPDKESKKEKKGLKKIKKEDIGLPFDFRHVSHIGWDANEAFGEALLDPQLKQFLARAGISETQLRDPETRDFIHDFIEAHGGVETVKKEMSIERPPSPEPVQLQPPPTPPPEIIESRSDQHRQLNITAAKPRRKAPPYLQNLKTKIADSPRFKQAPPSPPLSSQKKHDSIDSLFVKIDLEDENKPETEKLNSLDGDRVRRPETVYYSSLPKEKRETFPERMSLNTSAAKPRVVRPAPPLPAAAAKSSFLLPFTKVSEQQKTDPTSSETLESTLTLSSKVFEEKSTPVESVTKVPESAIAIEKVFEPLTETALEKDSESVNKEDYADDVPTKSDSEVNLLEEKKVEPLQNLEVKASPRPVPIPAPRKKSSQPP